MKRKSKKYKYVFTDDYDEHIKHKICRISRAVDMLTENKKEYNYEKILCETIFLLSHAETLEKHLRIKLPRKPIIQKLIYSKK